MNKTQQIKDLNIEIDYLTAMLQSEEKLTLDLMKQADATDKLHKVLSDQEKARHAAEKKAATEAATLKSVREGFIPIEVLRDLTGAEYTTEHCQSFTKTNLTVMLNAAKPVDKAILAALLEKPKLQTGYASGGLLSGFDARFANQYLYSGMSAADLLAPPTTKTHLHYNPSIITPGVVA